MLRTILERTGRGGRYWLLIVSLAAVMFVFEGERIGYAVRNGGAYSALDLLVFLLSFDRSRTVAAGLMAGICGVGFCEMRENGYDRYCLLRISPGRFAGAWLAANAILTLLASILGFTLLYGLFTWLVPAADAFQSYASMGPYGDWAQALPFSFFLTAAFAGGLSFAVLSLVSMLVVSYFPSRYVAVGVPVVVTSFLYGFGAVLLPWLDFFSVSAADCLFAGRGPVFHLLYTLFYFGLWYGLLSALFVRRMRKI